MWHRRTLLKSAIASATLAFAAPATAQTDTPTPVVATFSILGDMVKRIGGEHVEVTTLVGADGDAHVYQPTPTAARAVSESELLVVNGLGFEGWLDRLIAASDFDGVRVAATDGIDPIAFNGAHDHSNGDAHADEAGADHDDEHDAHGEEVGHDHDEEGDHDHDHAEDGAEAGHDRDHDEHEASADHDHEPSDEARDAHDHDHGAFDPHAWQSLENAVTYVDNITAALAKADPENAADFYQNRAAYVAEIRALDSEIHEIVENLPEDRRIVVTSHDAFQYFARDYGLRFLSPQGVSTESEASAQDVARLIETIREEGVDAVFFENIADTRLLERIADETGASIGGTLYPGALSGPDGPAPSYLDMMRHNATTLADALSS